MYPVVCKLHKEHSEGCFVCRAFDRAVRETVDSYRPPPHQHPAVLAPQVRDWISSVFPPPIHEP
jgi:hypothetical protein